MTEVTAETGTVAQVADAPDGPVFVLCAGRSGSTLLRFLLDAHPDLACPPETNVPALCGQLATVWSLIEGAPLSANRGDEPPEIPDAAIAGVRETMDRMIGSYLARRGKKRYCDKSLGTARFAYLMNRVWPEAKFICLFRHPMDVIASGIEACPWGLNGYGFDQYVSETPGNTVFALARFWADNAAVILAAQEQYADRCLRVRYEDLVWDPESTAGRLFEFLGVAQAPGISRACFATERERFGPADYKIWHTSRISTDSVGRGWTVPAGLIGPQVRSVINELCARLDYVPVDEAWGTADPPADLRLSAPTPSPDATRTGLAHADLTGTDLTRTDLARTDAGELMGERLKAGLSRLGQRLARRWPGCAGDSFTAVATRADGAGPDARWLVDLAAGTLTALAGARTANGGGADAPDEPDTDWDIVGPADAWERVIEGRTNLSVALRHNQLRYCDADSAGGVVADARIGMLADLLGLTAWDQTAPTGPEPAVLPAPYADARA